MNALHLSLPSSTPPFPTIVMASEKTTGRHRASATTRQSAAERRTITPSWNPRYISQCSYNEHVHEAYPYEPALNAIQSSLYKTILSKPNPPDACHLMRIALEVVRLFLRPLLYTDIPDDARHHAVIQWHLLGQVHAFNIPRDRVVGGECRIEKVIMDFQPANVHEGAVKTFALDFIRAGMAYFGLLAHDSPASSQSGGTGVVIPPRSSSLRASGCKDMDKHSVPTTAVQCPAQPSGVEMKPSLQLSLNVFLTGADAALEALRRTVFVQFDDARVMWAGKIRASECQLMILGEIRSQILMPIGGEQSGQLADEGTREEEGGGHRMDEEVDSSSDSWEDVWFGEEGEEEEALSDLYHPAASSKDAEQAAPRRKVKKIKNAKLLRARARLGK